GGCFPADSMECQCGTGGACSPTELCCDTNGTESCINPLADLQHCGACGNTCGQNQICTGNGCACSAGYGDCDGDPDNGCETNLEDSANCGACGNTCLEGTSCDGQQC